LINRLVDVTHAGGVHEFDNLEAVPQKKSGRETVVTFKINTRRQRHIGDEEIAGIPRLVLVESFRRVVPSLPRRQTRCLAMTDPAKKRLSARADFYCSYPPRLKGLDFVNLLQPVCPRPAG
jgi:hypothetical protein